MEITDLKNKIAELQANVGSIGAYLENVQPKGDKAALDEWMRTQDVLVNHYQERIMSKISSQIYVDCTFESDDIVSSELEMHYNEVSVQRVEIDERAFMRGFIEGVFDYIANPQKMRELVMAFIMEDWMPTYCEDNMGYELPEGLVFVHDGVEVKHPFMADGFKVAVNPFRHYQDSMPVATRMFLSEKIADEERYYYKDFMANIFESQGIIK